MLQTTSIEATTAWYETMLGFRRVSPPDLAWCRLERDRVAIMFAVNAHQGPPHATATQYIYVDNVMAVYETVRGRCQIEWGPEQMPYGMPEFAIRDNNGYLLSFGQRVPD
jgi:catechol 2,3-dioxygenase-like lactoylglutathione lyase family enzyme